MRVWHIFDFGNLKNELINSEVADLAINFQVILSDISSRYSSDAYVDFNPKITSRINRFDVALKVNVDLKMNLSAINKDNQRFAKALKIEKNLKKQNF